MYRSCAIDFPSTTADKVSHSDECHTQFFSYCYIMNVPMFMQFCWITKSLTIIFSKSWYGSLSIIKWLMMWSTRRNRHQILWACDTPVPTSAPINTAPAAGQINQCKRFPNVALRGILSFPHIHDIREFHSGQEIIQVTTGTCHTSSWALPQRNRKSEGAASVCSHVGHADHTHKSQWSRATTSS